MTDYEVTAKYRCKNLEEAKELVQTLSKDERLDAIEMEKQDEW